MTGLALFGGSMLVDGFNAGLGVASWLEGRATWPYVVLMAGQAVLAWRRATRLKREFRR